MDCGHYSANVEHEFESTMLPGWDCGSFCTNLLRAAQPDFFICSIASKNVLKLSALST